MSSTNKNDIMNMKKVYRCVWMESTHIAHNTQLTSPAKPKRGNETRELTSSKHGIKANAEHEVKLSSEKKHTQTQDKYQTKSA